MIRTNLLAGQGLGNQLWVYAACRGIANKHKLPFSIGGAEYFKGKSFLEIDLGSPSHPTTNELNSSLVNCEVFRERLFYDPELSYLASDYDSRVENISGNTVISGLFQSERYFYDCKPKLNEWIRLSEELKEKSEIYENTCVLNVRGGEYKRHKNLILPKSYWVHAIENIKKITGIDQFLIVTDDPAYGKAMLPNIPVLIGGIGECYAALYGAACHIVSNSSFSYFPIKSRIDSPYVIAPYLWSRPNNTLARWASPANLYSEWVWQDTIGTIHNIVECRKIRDRTINSYLTDYVVSAPLEYPWKKSALDRIPIKIKNPIKRALSKICPTHFG